MSLRKLIVLILVSAAPIALASCAQSHFDAAAEGKALLQRDAEWAATATAGKDVDRIVSYWSDAAVVIEPGEEFTVKPRGGGGTSHVPVFEWLEANGDDVECILCLTDLETQFPRTPPSVPTLWISTLDLPAPFGEVLVVE